MEFENHANPEREHANPGRDMSSGFVLEVRCFGTMKTIDSALGVFMKVVDNCLRFPEHFESSHLDIFSSRYSQNTERCSDTDQGHGPCRRPVCVNFLAHGPCNRPVHIQIRAHGPCRPEGDPCWRFCTLKTIDSALGVFMKVVDNSLSFSEHFESP